MSPDYKKISHYIAGWIISLSIHLLIVCSLQFNITFVNQLLFHYVLWTFFYCVFIIPKLMIFPLIYGSFVTVWIQFFNGGGLFNRMISFLIWSWEYIFGFSQIIPAGYDIYLVLTLSTLICISISWIIRRSIGRYVIVLFGTLFIIQWFRFIDEAFLYFNLFFLGVGLLYIIEYSSEIFKKPAGVKKNIDTYYSMKLICYGVLILMTIIGIANLIGLDYAPLQLGRINEGFNRLFPGAINLRSTPFSNKIGERLGGSAENDGDIIMLVKAEKMSYLRGSIKDYYTGNRWNSTHDSFDLWNNERIREKVYAHEPSLKIDIYPIKMNTSTLFATNRTIAIETENKIYYNVDMEFFINKSFLNLKKQPYRVYSQLSNTDLNWIKLEMKLFEENKDSYLQLPANLPNRVRQLAMDITKTKENSFVKMKEIESYLRTNYLYTLDVDEVPLNNDFVDYFLFHERKGYCTYFASAMAVLGRSIGIPTRYVEGYLLPNEPNDEGYYEVRGNRAHAWVEAYIDDMGWITFESTPAYETNTPSMESIQEIQEKNAIYAKTNNANTINSINQNYLGYKFRLEQEESNRFYKQVEELPQKGNLFLYTIAVFVLLAIAGKILYNTFKRYRHNKINEKTNRNMIQSYYHEIFLILKHIKKGISYEQTPREILHEEGNDCLVGFIDEQVISIIERAFYNEKVMMQWEVLIIKDLKEYSERILKQRIGLVRFFVERFIFGSI